MSAKKARKTQAQARPKARARFPKTEAALAGLPPAEAAAAAPPPAEAPAEVAAPDAGHGEAPAEQVADTRAVGGPAGEGATTDEATAREGAPAAATPPGPAPADDVAEIPGGAPTTQAPAGAAGEAPPTEVATATPTAGELTGAAGAAEAAAAPGAVAEATPPAGPAAPAAPGPGTKGRQRRATKAKADAGGGTAKRLSALDAAAKVLAEAGQPLGCQEMVEAMAARGYWTSPAGRTPAATLYAGILKEITTKGQQSRFRKAGRGQFVLAAAV